jgi:hypothetical protein
MLRTGSITTLCTCARERIKQSAACCRPCWQSLPASLRTAYRAARAKDAAGEALEAATRAIREYLARQTAGTR